MEYYSIWDDEKVTYIEPVISRNQETQQIELSSGFYETFYHEDTLEEMQRKKEEEEAFEKECADARNEALYWSTHG